jgi:hypothetical protein
MVDGVPHNDPFGGWVYWTGIPLEAADRIEVVDNASSSVYGNYAMGGVINVLTPKASRRTLEFKTQYGSRNTPKLDFRGTDVWGKLGIIVDGSAFDTDGYVNVVPSERRTTDQTPPGVDNNVAARFHNFNVRANYDVNDRVKIFGRVGYLRENRDNGKASTFDGTEEANDTTWTTTNIGVRAQLPDSSSLQATLFTDNETFHSNFLGNSPPILRGASAGFPNQTVPTSVWGNGPVVAHHHEESGADGWRRLALGGRREPGDCHGRRAWPDAGHKPVFRRRSAPHRRLRAGRHHAEPKAAGDLERPAGALAQLRSPQSRNDNRDRPANREQQAFVLEHEWRPAMSGGSYGYRRESARRGPLSRDRCGQCVGRLRIRLPCADAE